MTDMEEKVEYTLQIINEEGDSFAVRAEMYYKKRPELVNFVEDCFRGYRALADRYDLLSKDLQNANRTIAAVHPERVQLSMDDDDEEIFPKVPTPFQEPTKPPKALPALPPVYISPKSASFRKKTSKAPTRLMSKKGLLKFGVTDAAAAISKSGLTKSEAIEEIDRLQKGILALQTEKEFVKSSYENGLAKCLEIEKKVTDMQVRVSCLQDEFAIERVIEDDEARMLMAATALNSCQEKLCSLQDKQEQSVDEAKVEAKRFNDVREKFETMIEQLTNNEKNSEEQSFELKNSYRQTDRTEEKMHDLGLVKVNMKEHLLVNGDKSLTVSELAEKIDELVDTVINLETSVSSQNALVKRLRSESNELQEKLKSLEVDKETLIEGSDSKSNKIRELEEELFRLQSCNQCVKDQVKNLQSLFKEDSCNVVKPVDKVQNMVSPGKENFVQPNPNKPFFDLTQAVNMKPDDNVENIDSSQEVRDISRVDNVSGYSIETKEEAKKHDQSMYVKGEEKDSLMQTNSSNHIVDISQDVKGSSPEKAFKEHEVDKDAGNDSVSIKDSKAEEGLMKDAILQSEQCNSHLDDLSPKGLDKDVPVGNSEKALKEYENVSAPSHDLVILNHNNFDDKGHIVQVHDHGLKKTKEEEHIAESNRNNELDDISLNVQLRTLCTNIKEGSNADENKTAPDPVKAEENKSNLNNHLSDHPLNVKIRTPNTNDEKGLKENASLMAPSNSSLIATNTKAKEKEKENNHLDDQELKEQENDDENQFLFETDEEDQPNWRELFLSDLEDREKLLLKEYTSVLKNFKQLKKKLSEAEKKHRANLFKSTVQLKVLQSANASKEAEIESLHKKLNLFQTDADETPDTQDSMKGANFKDSDTLETNLDKKGESIESTEESTASEHKKVSTEENKGEVKPNAPIHTKVPTEDDVEMKLNSVDEGPIISSMEEKIRMDLDDLLEENIEFWLRYSTSFHQVQKFQTTFEDLQKELAELRENKTNDGSIEQSNVQPIYKHLREIRTELTLWLEQNGVLEDDLQNRLTLISSIQDEISRLSSAGSQDVDETELSDYQAARFTGEVMNMKHENNKVADELLVGIQRVKRLKIEIELAVAKLDEEFGISAAKNQQTRNSKCRLPLRSFLFGVKIKKQKASLFSCISPAIQRQHSDLYSAPSPK